MPADSGLPTHEDLVIDSVQITVCTAELAVVGAPGSVGRGVLEQPG